MSLLRVYIRERLIKENIQAVGMCFPFAYQKAEEWFEKYFTPGGRGRKLKRHPDLNDKSKFKVVHGTVTNKWKNPPKPVVHGWVEMGDLVFDDQTRVTKPNGIEKEVYYDMYQPEVYKEFTAEEAILNCAIKGGEGPWDDDLYAQMQDRDAWMKESRVREYIGKLLFEQANVFLYRSASEDYVQNLLRNGSVESRGKEFVSISLDSQSGGQDNYGDVTMQLDFDKIMSGGGIEVDYEDPDFWEALPAIAKHVTGYTGEEDYLNQGADETTGQTFQEYAADFYEEQEVVIPRLERDAIVSVSSKVPLGQETLALLAQYDIPVES